MANGTQIVINNLKDGIIAAELMIETLEKTKEAETHKWEHGDIFLNEFGVHMIYIRAMDIETRSTSKEAVYCISGSCDCWHKPADFLKNVKFLYNIKEKL